ncbi:MAG: DUF3110 domain-containing protein [Cyanobacteria bacterium SID2]|nr:DUF3110 domain-containing protein [Cyanobacteria bacterium SID2]MBP0003375.1 DUF3110 domain-containing protein [Cyanobacteria bacterium SBC]
MRIYVLLFNARTENEGIHTIRLATPEGEERNIVMMFESQDDAERYAMLLEAQDFYVPTVEEFDSEEIEEFCASCQYEAKLIPEGFVPESPEERIFLAPPETNLEDTEWEREQQRTSEPAAEEASEMSSAQLDDIRRRLEGLL